MCLNSNILNSMKLEFEKNELVQALLKHQTLPLNVHTSEGFKSDLNFMKILVTPAPKLFEPQKRKKVFPSQFLQDFRKKVAKVSFFCNSF